MTLFGSTEDALDAGGGALLILLGVAVALVRPRTAAARDLAVFACSYGVWAIALNLATPDDALAAAAGTVAFGAAAVAAAALGSLVLRLVPRAGRRPWAIAASLALVGATLAGVVVEHPFGTQAFAWAVGSMVAALVGALMFVALSYGAFVGPRPRWRVAAVTVALAVQPGLTGGAALALGLPVFLAATLPPVLAVAAVWFVHAWRRGEGARMARNLALVILVIVVAGGLVTSLAGSPEGAFGVARVLAVAMLVYAIFRHQLLDLDLKLKWTLKQSTVAAIFVAVFFAASEAAQAMFSQELGPAFGIAAAAALVFAIHPLQGLAQRVADKAMPGVKGVGEMSPDERAAVYRGLATVAWADGTLSGDERMMLEEARARLDLDPAAAAAIEREAIAASKGVA